MQVDRAGELSRQHLCNLLWAYAVADARDEASAETATVSSRCLQP